MSNRLTRKQFLRDTTKYAAGVAVGVGAINVLSKGTIHASSAMADWPWPYEELDTEKVRILGHDSYWTGKGCAYGAFNAIIQALRDKIGDPYTTLPTEIMIYGAGGGVEWGTLCGAPNGAAAAISLVNDKATTFDLVNELLGWYTTTQLPTDTSNTYAVEHQFTDQRYDQALPQNISGSPLCHASVTEWCKAAKFSATSTERKERCARLTGDVAAFAVKILNDKLAGTFTPTYTPPSTIAGCMACHGPTVLNNVAAKMECTQCHGNPHGSGAVEMVSGVGSTYELLQNYPNPFNPSTKIQFKLPTQENVQISIFDVHGREVRTLISSQQYGPGTFSVEWDGKDNNGKRVASGIYFSRMQAGTYSAVRKMSLVK